MTGPSAPGTTVIRNAAWIVAWDAKESRHVYLKGGDVVFANGVVTQVGGRYTGEVDVEMDGSERMVMPGLVNIHSHPTSEPLRKGVTDEIRSPGFFHSSLYEFLTIFENDPEGLAASLRVAMAELLTSGVTTVVDYSFPFDAWLDVLAESGIRACVAPMFKDAKWYTNDGHQLQYDWDESGGGRAGFEKAMRTIDLANQHPSGRLMGMLAPAQIDTCSADLLRDSYDYAQEKNLPWQTHAAQSVNEFQEMIRRHGRTPVQWMSDIGVLGEHAIIGHGIFLDHHPWVHWSTREDLRLLADSGTTVAHCPTVFMRRGITLRTFGGYVREGINMGIGTDTYPHNFLEEMRNVATVARTIAETVDDLNTSDIFNAATVGGARALRRDDIGKLAVGCRADLVCVDLTAPSMMPVREPIRSLIYASTDRGIRDVFVDGNQVVKDGAVTTIDLRAALTELQAAQERSFSSIPTRDWAGRTVDQMAPMVFETRDSV
ncbi:amidohydrolase family protein [Thalassobaculum salexigens]|uniref:amidohydrolase family protein n=1 Tax=Thalassobaculum salexigens TaxID=455360 RepID=UPI00248EFB33|nr:amidohydrolase family protein [Thalassobaculum salexigens]